MNLLRHALIIKTPTNKTKRNNNYFGGIRGSLKIELGGVEGYTYE